MILSAKRDIFLFKALHFLQSTENPDSYITESLSVCSYIRETNGMSSGCKIKKKYLVRERTEEEINRM